MNTEQTDLERRAARHAALSDPARLLIVDLLGVGDFSPSELQSRLGMSSNLLAHHLRTLEDEGIVNRTRSEGDKSRSYVKLVPEALATLAPQARLVAKRVVFVCTGNAARSPLAAAYWGTVSDIPTISAGVNPADHTSAAALSIAERHGLDLTKHVPRRITGVLTDGDLLVTVCDRAHEAFSGPRALHWSVPNPGWVGTLDVYEVAFSEIARRVTALAPKLARA
ncbi:MAG: ArsR family transcriptional regulator [Gulosibacter sp.]|uniref:arsenate reductase/protein-tyrosine-phosphatase family protein n=1 Tax=Gulosibacter sp. TaxID=2817531 RepID=UPI003F93DB9A